MIVVFLKLLGISQLSNISMEAANDNVFSVNLSIQNRKTGYPKNMPLPKSDEKLTASAFDYIFNSGDTFVLGSNNIELFIEQLCNFLSSLFIQYSKPFRKPFRDIYNVDSDMVSSHEYGALRWHKAFPILFTGGLSAGDECSFFKKNSIQNGKFCYDDYNFSDGTYLNALQLEHSGKGPRLFCDKSVADSIQNKRIIRKVNEEQGIFEIVWTIEGCETSECSSDSWHNVLDSIQTKLLPAAINFVKFYKSDQNYVDILPDYEEFLRLVCCGIVKYANDKCNKGEEALEKINYALHEKELNEYTLSELLNDFIE